MSHPDDYRIGGIWPLQDHDPDADIGGRSMMAAQRIERHSDRSDEPFTIPEPSSKGDVLGGLLVRERDGKREYLHGWWLTGCPVISQGPAGGGQDGFFGEFGLTAAVGAQAEGGWLPQRRAGEADDRFGPIEPEHPALANQLYPAGWTGLVSAGSEETAQREILHPDFLGLVAPHRGGLEPMGTPVFDVDGVKLDRRRYGRLQDHLRVALLPPREGCMPGAVGREDGLLPWQLGIAKSGVDTAGLVADEATEVAPAKPAPPRGDTGAQDLPPGVYDAGGGQLVGPNPSGPGWVPYDKDGNPLGGTVYLSPPTFSGPGTGGSVTRFGETVERDPGGTQVDDVPSEPVITVVGGQQWLAMSSVRHGGPLDVGGAGCQHQVGSTVDGEAVGQLHHSTQALVRGPGWDVGVFYDQAAWVPPTADGPIPREVYHRVDPGRQHQTACGTYAGLGAWEVFVNTYTTPPFKPPPPPPPRIPPPPPPRIPPVDDPFDDPLDPDDPFPFPEPIDGLPRPETPGPLTDPVPTGGAFADLLGAVPVIGSGLGFTRKTGFGQLEPHQAAAQTASIHSLMAPGVTFRAPNRSPGAEDVRLMSHVPHGWLAEHDATTPVIGQFLPVGAIAGGTHNYGTKPGDQTRWLGGDADGMVAFTPPDVELGSPLASSSRQGTFLMHPETMLAFGDTVTDTPLTGEGVLTYNAWWIRRNRANGNLVTTSVASNGTFDSTVQHTHQGSLHLEVSDANDAWSFNPHEGYGKYPIQVISSTPGDAEPGATFGAKVWYEEVDSVGVAVGPVYQWIYTTDSFGPFGLRMHTDPNAPTYSGTITADGLTGNLDAALAFTSQYNEGAGSPNDITFQVANAPASSGGSGGDFVVDLGEGDGAGTDGDFVVKNGAGTAIFTVVGETGKVTIPGTIDPDSIIFQEQASIPTAAAAGTGTIYVKNTAPSTLIFVDDTGAETTLGAGGGAPTDAEYLVATANGTLTAERVTTDTATISWDHGTAAQAKANVVAASIGTTQLTDEGVTDAKLRHSAGLSVIGRSANTTGDPADITAGTDGHVLRRSGTAIGFGTIATAGIADDAVTDAKIRDSAALSVIGRSANSTGDPADIAASSDGEVLRRSGTSLGFGTVATAGIADEAVTYAKMQHVSATDKVLGRSTAGAGDVEEIACTAAGRALLDDADASAQRTTLGLGSVATESTVPVAKGGTGQTTKTAAMDELSPTTTKGDILVDDGTNVIRLAVGSNDQVLTADSAQASGLKWAAAGGGGSGKLLLIERKEISGSAVTSTTFSGLDGNNDGQYILVGYIINGSASNNFVTMEPNGTSTGQDAERVIVTGGADSHATRTALEISFVWASDFSILEAHLYPATGDSRAYHATGTQKNSTTDHRGLQYYGGWSDTSTNITSLDVQASVANGLGVGTILCLYKLEDMV